MRPVKGDHRDDDETEDDGGDGTAQDLRAAYRAEDLTEGRRRAKTILATFPTCHIPEIARLGRTLRRWKHAFLAYFTTRRSNNGGTEGINGVIELHRRLARGYRNQNKLPPPQAPRRRRPHTLIPTKCPKSRISSPKERSYSGSLMVAPLDAS